MVFITAVAFTEEPEEGTLRDKCVVRDLLFEDIGVRSVLLEVNEDMMFDVRVTLGICEDADETWVVFRNSVKFAAALEEDVPRDEGVVYDWLASGTDVSRVL